MIILDSRTFLGLTPEWAGVLVSLIALIVAAHGFRELIKSKGDTQKQINSLTRQATEMAKVNKHMASLAQMQRDENTVARRKEMPRLSFVDSSSRGHYIGVNLRNDGGRISLLKVTHEPANVLFVCPEDMKMVEPGGKVHFQWSSPDQSKPGWAAKPLMTHFTLQDTYGFLYKQTVTKTTHHHSDHFEVSMPEEINPTKVRNY